MTAVTISHPRLSALLAEATFLEPLITQATSFSIEKASNCDKSAEYIALMAWKEKACNVLARYTIFNSKHPLMKKIYRWRWKA